MKSIAPFSNLGANNHSIEDRQKEDYYATDPEAVKMLLKLEKFNNRIWEPACGEGHISKVLIEHGYDVTSTDLIDRGFGKGGSDFLQQTKKFNGDIITNPPYTKGLEFVEHAIKLGNKVAMFLKLQFLEGKRRRKFFDKYPPIRIYVSSSRLACAKNGKFNAIKNSAVCYCWYIWEPNFKGNPEIIWFN